MDSNDPDDHRHDVEDDELEQSELARRLRRMDWPGPSPEVKERCLEQILARVGEMREENGDPVVGGRGGEPD
jgi:hypothetical protein